MYLNKPGGFGGGEVFISELKSVGNKRESLLLLLDFFDFFLLGILNFLAALKNELIQISIQNRNRYFAYEFSFSKCFHA